jgi:prepilin-type N-terminal cleavage/methylation domain-containing protein
MTVKRSSRRAFTLVELIVTVAIAGVLSAIAAGALREFRQRVYNSQGKAALFSLYSLQKSFHTEFNTYTTRLDAVGFSLTGKTFMNVHIGRGAMGGPSIPPNGPQGTPDCFETCDGSATAKACQPNLECAPSAYGYGMAGTLSEGFATQNSFQARSHGHFYKGSHFLDVSFGINEQKQLTMDSYPY